MAIRAIYPDIKPSLNLDFANTKSLDPRITFTRTTTATYYDGKTVAKAEENLLLQSQDFTTTWANTGTTDTANTDVAPDGTITADTITATAANGTILQTYTAVAGSYTFSVWLRRKTGTGDIQIAADSGTWTTKTISATWTRYDVTQTVAAGSKTAGIRIVTDTDEVYAWGAQLEQRSSVTAYTATTTQAITNYVPVLQTAAAGQARFDHNPVTSESLGLLVEEQRSNLFTRSDDFANAIWGKTNSTISSNVIIAPDGTLTGDKFVEDSGSVAPQLSQSISVTSGTSYTLSVYAKEDATSAKRYLTLLLPSAQFGSNVRVTFNLANGTSTSTNNPDATSITAVGNGWYRCSVTEAATSTGTAGVQIRLFNATPDTLGTYTGDGYSGIYIWGAQLEAGAFPTSYIPTVAASVTRNADAASMTGTNFSSWFRADEGTVYVDAPAGSGGTGDRNILSISNNTTDQRIQIGTGASFTVWNPFVVANAAAQATLTQSVSYPPQTNPKVILAYQVNNFAASTSGVSPVTDTSGIISVVDRLYFGGSNGSVNWNSTIRKLAFYPKRLTNTELQALTS